MPNAFSHLYQLDEFISNFRVVGWCFSFSNFKRNFCLQTVENLIRHHIFAASDLVLHCLPVSHKKDDRLIWVNAMSKIRRKKIQNSHKFWG